MLIGKWRITFSDKYALMDEQKNTQVFISRRSHNFPITETFLMDANRLQIFGKYLYN